MDWSKEQANNLLYVALTRARKTLSVPESIKQLIRDFDQMHFLVDSFKKDPSARKEDDTHIMGRDRKLTKGDVWAQYHDVCLLLRNELGISDGSFALPSLFPECDEESYATEQGEASNSVPPSTVAARVDHVADFFDV